MKKYTKKIKFIFFLVLIILLLLLKVIVSNSIIPNTICIKAAFILLVGTFLFCTHLYMQAKKDNYHYTKEQFIESINSTVIKKCPSGIILLNDSGIIQYVNPAIKVILGTVNTVGVNMFDIKPVRETKVYKALEDAYDGISTEIKSEKYISFSTLKEKRLNIYVYPQFEHKSNYVKSVIVIMHDITEEINLLERLEKNYFSTIEALATLVDAKDAYTGEHSNNVTKYTEMICKNLDIPSSEKERIILSAKFHDIGKIGISDLILNKPDKLTKEEYEKMKTHAAIGANIIKMIDELKDISEIIRHHHERWDGNGYPSQLKGNEIPYGAQIIAVADSYDAMISDRIYRKGMPKEKAIKILIEEKNKQFNGKLVDIFTNCINTIEDKDNR
jgi:putative nucleotidyltransferase with HDIG domain